MGRGAVPSRFPAGIFLPPLGKSVRCVVDRTFAVLQGLQAASRLIIGRRSCRDAVPPRSANDSSSLGRVAGQTCGLQIIKIESARIVGTIQRNDVINALRQPFAPRGNVQRAELMLRLGQIPRPEARPTPVIPARRRIPPPVEPLRLMCLAVFFPAKVPTAGSGTQVQCLCRHRSFASL